MTKSKFPRGSGIFPVSLRGSGVSLVALIILSCSFCLAADTNVIFQTRLADGTTNTWTEADLVEALGLINRKYHRDCKTPGGRQSWHGKLKKEVINEEAETKTEIHEDGKTFIYKWKKVTPIESVREANKRLSINTNGVPATLARAMVIRQLEKQTTNVVTHVLKAN
jgi:hypothetical protein